MSKNFKTVNEVIKWKNFILNGEVYDLSHLDAHWVEYVDNRDINKSITYNLSLLMVFTVLLKLQMIQLKNNQVYQCIAHQKNLDLLI